MFVVFWLDWVPPTSVGKFGDRWKFYVDITGPDGTKETMGPFTSDPVGGGYIWYTPTQMGTYTVMSRFPGQKLTGIPGREDNINVNDTFAPSTSNPTYFTVQQEQIPRYIETPLPTDYWTRPVYDTNRGWGSFTMGQWLSGDAFDNKYTGLRVRGIPYTTGPESSHILWTRPVWSGGVMGGQFNDVGYYTGIAYEQYCGPQIVLDGKAYYSVEQPPRGGWYCIDLYTGETLYYENNTDGTRDMPEFGQVLNIENPNQFGGFPYLWRTSGLGSNTWEMLDGFSGRSICKIANVSSRGRQFIDSIGSICFMNFVNLGTTTAPNYYMQIWNTTEAIWYKTSFGVFPPKTLLNGTTNIPVTTQSNDYWQWRPENLDVYDGNNGYSMNVSVASILGPRNSLVNQTGNILEIKPDEFVIVGTNGRNDDRGIVQGFLRAYSLKQPDWGQTLWDITFTPPKAIDSFPNSTYLGENGTPQILGVSSENGVFFFSAKGAGRHWIYSLETGQQLWEGQADSQWYYYGSSGSSVEKAVHNGRFYSIVRGGELTVSNATTGEFLWNWTAPYIGYLETPYTYTPAHLTFFADDKVYFQSYEGAGLNSPIRRDGAIFCIDTKTGEMLWRLTFWPGYTLDSSMPVIADGRFLALDAHDNQIYCIGKGPSATTVTGPENTIPLGEEVLIKGKVTDQSPSGRHTTTGNLDFSLKGTPAISDESMDDWMEYLFHQRPKPTDAKGVEVILETLDPNGNYYELGRTTTDTNGEFGCVVNPPVPGKYQIIATFEGSASYGPSTSSTYINIEEARSAAQAMEPEPAAPAPVAAELEPTTPEVTATTEAPMITTEIAIIAAVAVACIIGIVSFWALRKRK